MNKKVCLKMSELKEPKEVNVKIKNPKRIEAGKKGAEAKKLKSELRKKEELLKKENTKLKMDKEESITKEEPNTTIKIIKTSNIIKPLCLSAIVIGVGFYLFKNNQVKEVYEVKPKEKEIHKQKEIDPFEFN